jgi:GntR family transcriptional regulator
MMEMSLDHRSPVPLRAQVEQLVRDMIRRGVYPPGELLPDEMSLARRLGVSRATVRSGIGRLVFEGLLERKPGVGTRVARSPVPSGIGAWHSFTREMERMGIAVQTFSTVAEALRAPADVAAALQVPSGTETTRLDRVRGWDGEPVVHFRSWLHPRLSLTTDMDFQRPLYEIIETRASVVADRSYEEMTAVAAPADLAAVLAVAPGTPLLLRRRIVSDPGGTPIEYAVVHYRTDRFTLTMDIRRDRP